MFIDPFAVLLQAKVLPAIAFAGHRYNNRFSGFVLRYAAPHCCQQLTDNDAYTGKRIYCISPYL